MDAKPLVSIITPTYNHERFIGQCIESVLAQTYPFWEQIIIDDGSTDKTPEIVANFKDDRIHYIYQKNMGIWNLAKTYNKALSLAKGKLIAILEGDDFWPAHKLETQIQSFSKTDAILSWGKFGVTGEDGRIQRVGPQSSDKNDRVLFKIYSNRPVGSILKQLLIRNIIHSSTVIINKGALLSIGGFHQPKSVPTIDYATYLRLAIQGPFDFHHSVVGYWRRHKNQVSKSKEFIAQHTSVLNEFYTLIPPSIINKCKISIDDLIMARKHHVGRAYVREGTVHLLNHRWTEAKKTYKKGVVIGSWQGKISSLMGLAISYLKIDLRRMPWILHLTGASRLTEWE